MKIIRPYANIINLIESRDVISPLQQIEYAARISHRSEEMQTETSAAKFLRAVVLGRGDWSVVEHVTISVEMMVDRGITHELVRHRLFSFTQESTRFVNYEKKYQKGHPQEGQLVMPAKFIYPIVDVECEHCLNGDESMNPDLGIWSHRLNKKDIPSDIPCVYNGNWLKGIRTSETIYQRLLDQGWRPQEARSVFPNALASKIVMTGNLRNWRHFFLMRTTKEAHPQMRQVTIPLLAEFQQQVPVLFEDIVPNERQVVNIAKGR